MGDDTESAKSWAANAGQAAMTGAGSGSLFGLVGALIYSNTGGGTLSCPTVVNQQYDGRAYTVLTGTPVGCSRVVDLPVLGSASSVVDAATTYGITVAVIVFVLACIYLLAKS
jgi:hypothetical protein